MLATDKPAFETLLKELFAAIDKPLGDAAIEGFWKGLNQMSLMEFSRVRDLLLSDLSEHEAPKKFSVSDIWAAKKRLRAAPAPVASDQPEWTGDVWDIAANNRMMGLMWRAALARSSLTAAQVRTYVAFKNRWADLMRVSAVNGGVPVAEQNQCWQECLRMAEQEVAGLKAA